MYKSEDRILLEREKLSEEMKSLRATSQNLKKLIHDLEEERSKQKVVIQKLFQENLNNRVLMVDKFKFIFKFILLIITMSYRMDLERKKKETNLSDRRTTN